MNDKIQQDSILGNLEKSRPVISGPSRRPITILFILLELILVAESIFIGVQIVNNQLLDNQAKADQGYVSPSKRATSQPAAPIEFKGLITTLWGDGFSVEKNESKSVLVHTISNESESYVLQTSKKVPSLLEFDKKNVQIKGFKTEDPNIIQVTSIKIIPE